MGVLIGIAAIFVYLALHRARVPDLGELAEHHPLAGGGADARPRHDVRRADGRHRPLDRLGGRRARGWCSASRSSTAPRGGWRCSPASGSGSAFGLANGIVIGVLKIPFFVVTLGTLSIYQSIALLTTSGETVSLFAYPSFNTVQTLINGETGPFPTVLMLCGRALRDRGVRPPLHAVRPRPSTPSARTPRPRA